MKNNKGFTLQNFSKKNLGGFTLIEMLVVIAVIGILSAATLTALGPARNKAKDTKVIAALNNLKAIAEVKYDTATGFDYLFQATEPADIAAIRTEISSQQGDLKINDAAAASPHNAYLAYSKLPSDATKFFCVDSAGTSKQLTSAPGATVTVCP